jgi:hypothetical protein
MNTIIKAALMATLLVAAVSPLAVWANSTLLRDYGGSIQRTFPIAPFLMSDEDLQYGD